ncbi:hypothetical protein D3C71_1855930 [compost metagenome]
MNIPHAAARSTIAHKKLFRISMSKAAITLTKQAMSIIKKVVNNPPERNISTYNMTKIKTMVCTMEISLVFVLMFSSIFSILYAPSRYLAVNNLYLL